MWEKENFVQKCFRIFSKFISKYFDLYNKTNVEEIYVEAKKKLVSKQMQSLLRD